MQSRRAKTIDERRKPLSMRFVEEKGEYSRIRLKSWGFRHSCEAGLGDCTAEARSKEFLIKKFSDLCELGASVVNTSSQKTRNNQNL